MMEGQRKLLEEIIRRYSHRMPYPEKAASLMALYARGLPLPESEWELLSLSLLASTSEPLFLFLTSHPGKIPRFIELTHDRSMLGFEPMKESLLREIITGTETPPAIMGSFRLTHLSAILVLDALSILSFDEVTAALSHLSDAIAWTAVYLSEHKAVDEMGIPCHKSARDKQVPTRSAFFALGKWGAEELNYSSDIDIVAFYYSEGVTDKGFANQTFFDKMARSAFGILSSRELMGGEFKVDLDLRPRGNDGSLTLSFPAALKYYREQARFWEKQAWIKARQFYGDTAAGDEFLSWLAPVIFSKENAENAGDEIIRSRQQMIANLRFPEKDLKQGKGSIRDVEFAVQCLQIAGGGGRSLAERHTVRALHKLRDGGMISEEEESAVSTAYKTLRKAEHFAQAVNLRQSHLEPSDESGWKALDRFLGVTDSKSEIGKSRNVASEFFRKVTGGLLDERLCAFSEDELKEELIRRGAGEPERLAPLIAGICATTLKSEKGGIETAGIVRNALLEALFRASADEASLRSFSTVLPSLLSSGKSGLFDQDGLPQRIDMLLKLVSSSEVLREFLRSFPRFYPLSGPGASDKAGMTETAADMRTADLEEIRLQQKAAFFTLISEEILGGTEDFTENLTVMAEEILRACFDKIISRTALEFNISEGDLSSGITLYALGRLGFREMLYGSDLDLLFVKDGEWLLPSDPGMSHLVEKKLVSSLVEELTAITPNGSLYQVDLRLRPYGSAGVAVPSRELMANYFSKEARPWERLSYVKLRRIAGAGVNLEPDIPGIVKRKQVTDPEISGVREIIRRLHDRNRSAEGFLKFCEGGLFEQDLLLLGKTLSVKNSFTAGGGYREIVTLMESEKAFSGEEISTIVAAREFFLRALFRLRIAGSGPAKIISPRELSAGAWDKKEEKELRKEICLLIGLHFPGSAA